MLLLALFESKMETKYRLKHSGFGYGKIPVDAYIACRMAANNQLLLIALYVEVPVNSGMTAVDALRQAKECGQFIYYYAVFPGKGDKRGVGF